MSEKARRELQQAIVRRAFDRVYVLHGEDDYRKDVAVRELIAAAVDPATRDFNFEQLRGEEVTPEQLESALNTPPMMAERRVVVLRDPAGLRKASRAVLDRYLERPAPETVLVLVAAAGAKTDKALADAASSVEFAPLALPELLKWIRAYVTHEWRTTITDEAAQLLQSVVGDNTRELAAELDKLASYANGAAIGEAAVRDVVGVRHGETLSDFLDAVAARDAARTLALVEHVMALPRSGLVPILMALSVQTMALGCLRHALDRGLPTQRLESECFAILKETGAFPMRPWGEAAKSWARHVHQWDAASIANALDVLLAADRSAKDTRVSSDEQVLASVVCALSTPAARAAA